MKSIKGFNSFKLKKLHLKYYKKNHNLKFHKIFQIQIKNRLLKSQVLTI